MAVLSSPLRFTSPNVSVPFFFDVMVKTAFPLVSLRTMAFPVKVCFVNVKRSILALYSAISLSSHSIPVDPLAPPSKISLPTPPTNRSPPIPAIKTSFPASPSIKSLTGATSLLLVFIPDVSKSL